MVELGSRATGTSFSSPGHGSIVYTTVWRPGTVLVRLTGTFEARPFFFSFSSDRSGHGSAWMPLDPDSVFEC